MTATSRTSAAVMALALCASFMNVPPNASGIVDERALRRKQLGAAPALEDVPRVVNLERLVAEEPGKLVAQLARRADVPRLAERHQGFRFVVAVEQANLAGPAAERRENALQLRDEARLARGVARPRDRETARRLLDDLVGRAHAFRDDAPGVRELVEAQLPVDHEHGIFREQVLRGSRDLVEQHRFGAFR